MHIYNIHLSWNKRLKCEGSFRIAGAHTIGLARCIFFRGHIYNDSNIDVSFASSLRRTCPRSGNDSVLAPLDRSSRATEMDEDARTTTMMDAAGILTLEPRWRSIDRAWITDMLDWIAIGVVRNIPLDHIGKSLIRVLRSSTCCKVHSFHDLAIDPSKWRSPSVFNAARFKNLHQRRITSFFTLIWLWITRVDCRAHAVGLTTKSKYHASLSLQLKRSKVEIFILSRAVKISIIWSFKGIKENGYGKVCHPLMLHLKDGTKLLLVSYLYKESYFSLDFLILSN